MAEKRKDNKGRNLQKGEGQRKDGRYYFQYKDIFGKNKVVYSWKLADLREKEKQIIKDTEDGIDNVSSKISLNELFDLYISLKNKEKFRDTTKDNYIAMWDLHIRNTELGVAKICNIKPSHIKKFYAELKEKGLSNSTIKLFHSMLLPSFELAVNDDMIRKNPAKKCLDEYKGGAKEKKALTVSEQETLLQFVKESNVYNSYEPMLRYMLGTGCRIGEVIGITWNDIDMKNKEININHQIIYKRNAEGKTAFSISETKTEAGNRKIPMTSEVYNALCMQRKYLLYMGIPRDYNVNGYSRFVFVTKSGKPIAPNGFNNMLKNLVNAYNKRETIMAESEKREPILLPHISAHTFRHTACTRMAEAGVQPKTLQYILGHSDMSITMNVYTHAQYDNVKKEIENMEQRQVV